jgi:Uma2 family endonuclease
VYDRDFKFAAYSALGVRDVWRVDLQDRCVVVKAGAGHYVTHRQSFSWQPESLDHAVTIDVPALFEGILGDARSIQ